MEAKRSTEQPCSQPDHNEVMANQGRAGADGTCLVTSAPREALAAVTHLGPAAQVPGHCLAGRDVPHDLLILAGHLGQQLLCLHCAHIGKAHKLLGIHGATESTDQAFAIQEGDYDPDDGSNHGSLHDGGTHVPGAAEREVNGLMLAASSSSRALRDAGCPVPSSLSSPRELTPRAALSIAPADASPALGCLCCFCLSVKPALAQGSVLCAACTQCTVPSLCACLDCTLMSPMHRSLSALPCLAYSHLFSHQFQSGKSPFFCSLSCPSLSQPVYCTKLYL